MTKDETLKLALEALKQIDEAMPFPVAKLAQAAIKEALAQPEQDVGITRYADISVGKIIHNSSPPPRTWVGLTGEEIEASKPFRSNDAVVWELAVEWAEAKLKEKNG
jgi:hypothetical protein